MLALLLLSALLVVGARARAEQRDLFPRPGIYFGVFPDQPVQNSFARLAVNGRYPAMLGVFLPYKNVVGDQYLRIMDEFCQGALDRAADANVQPPQVHLTIQPADNGPVAPEPLQEFVDHVRKFAGAGLRMVVRWGPEFNLHEIKWGGNPQQFVANWAMVADAIGDSAAMFWCPNIANAALSPTTYDDYYPGDQYVDIVGVDIYYEVGKQPDNVADDEIFVKSVTGEKWPDQPLWNFYDRFAAAKNKPFVVGETAAYWKTATGEEHEIEVKSLWWNQLVDDRALQRFPLYKGFVWFNSHKREGNKDTDMRIFDEHSDARSQVLVRFEQDASARGNLLVFADAAADAEHETSSAASSYSMATLFLLPALLLAVQ
ncbi:GH26 domain-containing protein [Plasmodiophora brassicae]